MVEASHSVALVVDWQNLRVDEGGYRLLTVPLRQDSQVCPEEAFADQPAAPGSCSAFLVAADLVATASHCPIQVPCEQRAFVFDFAYQLASNEDVTFVAPDQVYTCQHVLVSQHDDGGDPNSPVIDYALIQLDRPVLDRLPLDLDAAHELAQGTALTLLGHPSGLPLKISTGAVTSAVEPHSFICDVDAFAGDSGSPLLDSETGLVAGVFIAGTPDWVRLEGRDCVVSHRCDALDDQYCRGQFATRGFVLAEAMDAL
jgi:V8-like Glu-specific endopeptidase